MIPSEDGATNTSSVIAESSRISNSDEVIPDEVHIEDVMRKLLIVRNSAVKPNLNYA